MCLQGGCGPQGRRGRAGAALASRALFVGAGLPRPPASPSSIHPLLPPPVVRCSVEPGSCVHPLTLPSLSACPLAHQAVVRCSVELGSYIHLANYVQKAEATPEAQVGRRGGAGRRRRGEAQYQRAGACSVWRATPEAQVRARSLWPRSGCSRAAGRRLRRPAPLLSCRIARAGLRLAPPRLRQVFATSAFNKFACSVTCPRRATPWCSPSWPAPRACTRCSRAATRPPHSSSQRRVRRGAGGGPAGGPRWRRWLAARAWEACAPSPAPAVLTGERRLARPAAVASLPACRCPPSWAPPTTTSSRRRWGPPAVPRVGSSHFGDAVNRPMRRPILRPVGGQPTAAPPHQDHRPPPHPPQGAAVHGALPPQSERPSPRS